MADDHEKEEAFARALQVLLRRRGPGALEAPRVQQAWESARKLESAEPQRLFALFSLMLDHRLLPLLLPEAQEQVLLPLMKFCTARLWGSLCSELGRGPEETLVERLKELIRLEQVGREGRESARVSLQEMLPALRWALPSFVPRGQGVDLRPASLDDRGGAPVAYTDGRDIYLATHISVFGRRELNELTYLRLLAHEALHIVEGSFDKPSYEACFGEVKALIQENPEFFPGHHEDPWLEGAMARVCALFGEAEGLFFGLFNLAEDARIERRFPEHFPGLALAARHVDRAIAEQAPPSVFEGSAGQVLRVLQALLDGEPPPALPTLLRDRFAPVRAAIQAFLLLDRPTLVDSIRLAARLTLWCQRHLPEATRKAASARLRLMRPIRVADVAVRVELAEPGMRSRSMLRSRIRLPGHWDPASGGGQPVPEFDFWDDFLRDPGAVVQEKPWDPYRAGVQGRAVRCEVLAGQRPAREEPVYRSTGRSVDPRRFVRFLVDRRTGGQVDPRVFRGAARQGSDTHAIAVVDLSISMVHFRSDGSRPLERAVGVIESLASPLDQGERLLLFGSVDPGPHQVQLFQIKPLGEPLSRQRLESLHGYGLGGFRIGPILRALAISNSSAGQRIPVYLITDPTNHYVTRGMGRVLDFEQVLCADCPKIGSTCQIEKPYPDEGWIGDKASIFEPLEYEIADIRHALETTSDRLDVHAFLLGDHWGDRLCDHAWGHGKWSRA